MRIASILVLAELIPVESTVLTKSPGSTGVYPSIYQYDNYAQRTSSPTPNREATNISSTSTTLTQPVLWLPEQLICNV